MENTPWYNKTFWIVLALILFFPLGFYALYKNETWSKNAKLIAGGVVGVVVMIGLLSPPPPPADGDEPGLAVSSAPEVAEAEPTAEDSAAQNEPVTEVGAPARAFIEGAQWIYLAVDRDAMDELIDVQNASDLDGLRSLGQQGKVFRIPNNTSVEVVERGGLLTKVRATEQDRVYTGREGWLQYEFVKPAGRNEAAAAGLPDYTVIDKVGDNLEVLIPSLSVDAPDAEIEAVARGIAEAERVGTVYLYRTEDAQRANMSASFAEQNPNAMSGGYLGMLQNGQFFPSTY